VEVKIWDLAAEQIVFGAERFAGGVDERDDGIGGGLGEIGLGQAVDEAQTPTKRESANAHVSSWRDSYAASAKASVNTRATVALWITMPNWRL
jgi:hypothetical protein